MGRHEEDPRPLRCKLAWHGWEITNNVRFLEDPRGLLHQIRQCRRCNCWGSRRRRWWHRVK